ncbi:ectonucleoside triphosphate diphosphohydrolase 1 isoform X1 [Brachionus plicatilis]|uniref:Ectonucleoside triphosphate diphosphohydrolase 1 isoform X1 n=1 Tax=Brachionus plicatilis TaxID=10195 RepID=A0A3M7T2E4_BRAPC|nr:ectonucleoside triphosphate diphosphohydrolase 1 isoform X1 [Brachionus plicatilis]
MLNKIALFFFLVHFNLVRSDINYAIQFDAGSSGTRMYVYEYLNDFKNMLNSNITLRQIGLCRTKGSIISHQFYLDKGIATIKTYTELKHSFSKCMIQARKLVPVAKWNQTLITLKATAGMRLSELSSPSISKTIFHMIRHYFNQSGFLYKNESQVETISGKDEALNAWITANFLANNFHQDSNESTKGVLDLGGASTQISFVPLNQSLMDNLLNKNLFGKNYSVYSQSFLCFGIDQARLVYRTSLINGSNDSASVLSPCMPKNFEKNFQTLDILRSPCGSGSIKNQSTNLSDFNVTLKGSSDFGKCQIEVKNLLSDKKECRTGQDACSFKEIKFPDTKEVEFYAISVFYYTVQASNLLFNSSFDSDIEGFRNVTELLCSFNYEELVARDEIFKADLKLLTKFGINTFENVHFVDKINGYNVGWNLGLFLLQKNTKAKSFFASCQNYQNLVKLFYGVYDTLPTCRIIQRLNFASNAQQSFDSK